jgi:hypothetical protein
MTEKIERKSISELKPDPQNANAGTERGLRLLDDSLAEVGLGRSVVTDKNGVIIAGNKTVERALDRGFDDAIVIKTTGNKLIVHQRDDLDLVNDDDEKKARSLAYYDNRAGEADLQWIPEQLEADREAGIKVVDKLWNPIELKELAGNSFAPNLEPDMAAQIYSQDDMDAAAQKLNDKFEQKLDKEVEMLCPDCGTVYYVKVKDLLHEANSV